MRSFVVIRDPSGTGKAIVGCIGAEDLAHAKRQAGKDAMVMEFGRAMEMVGSIASLATMRLDGLEANAANGKEG